MRTLLTSILIFSALLGYTQDKEKDMYALHAAFSFYLDQYYQISPWDDSHFHIDDLRLSADFPNDSLKAAYGLKGDSIISYDARDFCFGHALDNFQSLLDHPNFHSFPLDSLDESIYVNASPDGKLLSLTIDEHHGGTYLSQISVTLFRTAERTLVFLDDIFEDYAGTEPPAHPFNTDGYYEIDTLHTATGIVYHLSGSVKGCSSCIGLYHDFVRFDGDSILWLDGLEMSFRAQNAESTWNSAQRTLTLEYMQDDLNYGFQCGNGYPEIGDDDEEFDDTVIHTCIFSFIDNQLELKYTSARPHIPEEH